MHGLEFLVNCCGQVELKGNRTPLRSALLQRHKRQLASPVLSGQTSVLAQQLSCQLLGLLISPSLAQTHLPFVALLLA